MSLFWGLFQVGLNAFDAAYYLIFPTVKCGPRVWVRKMHIVGYWLLLTLLYSYIHFYTDFSEASVYLFPVLALAYALIFVQGRVLQRVFWLIFPWCVLIALEASITYVFAYVTSTPIQVAFGPISLDVLPSMICVVSEISFGLFILCSKNYKRLSLKNDMLFFSIIAICVIMIAYLFFSKGLSSLYIRLFFSLVPLLALSVNIVSYLERQKAGDTQEAKLLAYKRDLTEQAQQELLAQKTATEALHKELRCMYHQGLLAVYHTYGAFRLQFVHHLQTVWAQQKNCNEHLEIDAFIEANRLLAMSSPTGIDTLDAMLSLLKIQASDEGIRINIDSQIKIEAIVNPDDISLLLEDLLGDAIHLLRNLDDPGLSKEILLYLSSANDTLTIQLEYPVNNNVDYRLVVPCAAKKDADLRPSLAREIINGRGGNTNVSIHEYYLILEIRLPLPISGKVSPSTILASGTTLSTAFSPGALYYQPETASSLENRP